MPAPGKRWRLVTISTYASWLPGDERGFRTHHHKIHSSGDYKHRPPAGEHAGLRRYAQRISGPSVVIPQSARRTVGQALRAKLDKLGHRVLAVSVSGMHAHMVVELSDDLKAIRKAIGECKCVASHAIRDVFPAGCGHGMATTIRWMIGGTLSKCTGTCSIRRAHGCGRSRVGSE